MDLIKVVTKTPMRISFMGGGTDIPAFYQQHGGTVISSTIDKFVTVSVCQGDGEGLHAAHYPEYDETVWYGTELSHPIVRECLSKVGIDQGVSIEIESDVPCGSGLGGSSALTVGLLNALWVWEYETRMAQEQREIVTCYNPVDKETLACVACDIEINRLGNPIGKQDQYTAAYGGLKRYDFYDDGKVGIESIEPVWDFQPYLMLFDTGIRREAKKLLAQPMDVESLKCIKAQVSDFYNLLTIRRDYPELELGRLLHKTWCLKSGASDGISNGRLDTIYRTALDNGALGGKLLGAGGGGHFLFMVPQADRKSVRRALEGLAVQVPFQFEPRGSRIVHEKEKVD